MQCILKFIDGPSAGQSTAIAQGETISVGRNIHDVGIAIPNDALLSRRHFSVRWDGNVFVVQDEGSMHGTFLNEKRIAAPSPLKAKDLIRAGSSTLQIDFQADPTPLPPPTESSRETLLDMDEVATRGFVAERAAEVVSRFSLEGDEFAKAGENGCPQFIAELVKNKQFNDAIKFTAHALHKRAAVWWACRAVRFGLGERLTKYDESALEAAETWVRSPVEEQRRKAMEIADQLGHGTPACWTAVAAFWSGGSMAPVGAPIVPPADNLTGKAVFGAVQMAAVATEPEKAQAKQGQFIELALSISEGKNRWTAANSKS